MKGPCIFKKCAHFVRPCMTLGECGGAYALARANTREGYDVHLSNNPTIEALHKAGFVTLHWKEQGSRIVTVRVVDVKRKGRAA